MILRRFLLLIFLATPFAAAKQTALPPCDPHHFAGINYQVCESINQASELIDHDRADTALTILKDLPTDSTVAPELVTLIRSERIIAQRATALQVRSKSSALAMFWGSLASKANTLFTWLALLTLTALALFGLAQLPKLRKPFAQTLISFADQTVDKPSEDANMALTQEVDRLLNPMQEPVSEELIQEASSNGSGATFVNLQPISGTNSIETALAASGDVDLGAFKISPKALIQVWKDVFRPRYKYTLQGVLSKTGDTVFAYAQMLDAARKPIKGAVWSAICKGENARDAALRELMAKAMAKLSQDDLPSDIWQSLDYFQQSMDRCQEDKSLASISASQLLLQKSLKYDPSNWMARYNNALYLQIIGNYEDSLQNWSFLHAVLLHGNARGLRANEGRLALLITKVEYNRALTLARMGKWEELKQAVTILEGLVEKTSGDLKWLAMSALASALGTRYELLESSTQDSRPEKTGAESTNKAPFPKETPQEDPEQETGSASPNMPRVVSALDQTFAKIEAITAELTASLTTSEPISASLMHATAIARNARGTVSLNRGRSRLLALDDFNAAILLSPDLIDPRLNAARTVRMRRSTSWTLQVESLLKAVLRLDPSHREAHFLLGSLYLDQAVYRLGDAAEHFEKADPHTWASFELGGLHLNPSFATPDPQKALKYFRKSVRLGDAVDIRALRLVRLLLRMVGQQVTPNNVQTDNTTPAMAPALSTYELLEMLREAEQIARRIKKQTIRAEERTKVIALEEQARDLAGRLNQPPPSANS